MAHSTTVVLPWRNDFTPGLIHSSFILNLRLFSITARTDRLDRSNASTGWDLHSRWLGGGRDDPRSAVTSFSIPRFLLTESVIMESVFCHRHVAEMTSATGVADAILL